MPPSRASLQTFGMANMPAYHARAADRFTHAAYSDWEREHTALRAWLDRSRSVLELWGTPRTVVLSMLQQPVRLPGRLCVGSRLDYSWLLGGASKTAARAEIGHLYISVSSFRLPRRPRLRRPLFARSLSRAACSSTVRSVT